jgi:hypothetical protein
MGHGLTRRDSGSSLLSSRVGGVFDDINLDTGLQVTPSTSGALN